MKKKIAFFDTKPYDRESFDRANDRYEIRYFESRLMPETAHLADGCDAVCAFVNDVINTETLWTLYAHNVKVIAMRCAGYSNVDLKTASSRITVVRVPIFAGKRPVRNDALILPTLIKDSSVPVMPKENP